MSMQIKVPQMGESVTEGVIARWLKAEGDAVAADEPVVEIETDKITIEVPSPGAGVLRSLAVAEGSTVGVGQTLGEIDDTAKPASAKGKPAQAAPADSAPAQAASPPADKPDQAKAPEAGGASAGEGQVAAGPSARREANRAGVDLGQVSGTGRGGRVTKEDVMRAAEGPAPRATVPREERKPMSPLRRRVAERLVESQNTAAILTTFNEIDMSAVVELRKRYRESFEKRHGVRLGFMSFFIKAAIEALREFPAVNSEIDGDDLIYKHYYDIGVAVGGGKGLVVPVIRDADRLGFAEIEGQIAAFAEKAKNNRFTLEDLSGGTFTISNGGIYGSMMSTPIINPPQTGILGLHNIVDRPVVVDKAIEVRPIMYVALSYDHRIIDGREAVSFLVRIKQCIERPERLLLEV